MSNKNTSPDTGADLIVVRQLPVIEEKLKKIKESIQEKVAEALSLTVTDESVKHIKDVRAELNKDFKVLESERKRVKSEILAPYEQFEAVYRECVTNVFEPADATLKARIIEVESEQKAQRREDAEAFFNEYAASKNVDFMTFERAGINITLSASRKSILEQCRAVVDRIAGDITLIETMDDKAEVFVEYKKTLDLPAATTTVLERKKAIEAERVRREERQAAEAIRAATEHNVERVIEQCRADEVEDAPLSAPTVAPSDGSATGSGSGEPTYEASLTVTGTLEQLKALKRFLTEGGYSYVNI